MSRKPSTDILKFEDTFLQQQQDNINKVDALVNKAEQTLQAIKSEFAKYLKTSQMIMEESKMMAENAQKRCRVTVVKNADKDEISEGGALNATPVDTNIEKEGKIIENPEDFIDTPLPVTLLKPNISETKPLEDMPICLPDCDCEKELSDLETQEATESREFSGELNVIDLSESEKEFQKSATFPEEEIMKNEPENDTQNYENLPEEIKINNEQENDREDVDNFPENMNNNQPKDDRNNGENLPKEDIIDNQTAIEAAKVDHFPEEEAKKSDVNMRNLVVQKMPVVEIPRTLTIQRGHQITIAPGATIVSDTQNMGYTEISHSLNKYPEIDFPKGSAPLNLVNKNIFELPKMMPFLIIEKDVPPIFTEQKKESTNNCAGEDNSKRLEIADVSPSPVMLNQEELVMSVNCPCGTVDAALPLPEVFTEEGKPQIFLPSQSLNDIEILNPEEIKIIESHAISINSGVTFDSVEDIALHFKKADAQDIISKIPVTSQLDIVDQVNENLKLNPKAYSTGTFVVNKGIQVDLKSDLIVSSDDENAYVVMRDVSAQVSNIDNQPERKDSHVTFKNTESLIVPDNKIGENGESNSQTSEVKQANEDLCPCCEDTEEVEEATSVGDNTSVEDDQIQEDAGSCSCIQDFNLFQNGMEHDENSDHHDESEDSVDNRNDAVLSAKIISDSVWILHERKQSKHTISEKTSPGSTVQPKPKPNIIKSQPKVELSGLLISEEDIQPGSKDFLPASISEQNMYYIHSISGPSTVEKFPRNTAEGDAILYRNYLNVSPKSGKGLGQREVKRTAQFHRNRHLNRTSIPEERTSGETQSTSCSEGEVTCKCNASIGELHICKQAKNIKSKVEFLKRHPKRWLEHELGNPNVSIVSKKMHSENWYSYYVSNSSSSSAQSETHY